MILLREPDQGLGVAKVIEINSRVCAPMKRSLLRIFSGMMWEYVRDLIE